jgi:hypothetical protein
MLVCRRFLFPILLLITCNLRSQVSTWSLDGPAFSVPAADILTAAGRVHAEPFTDVTVLFEQEHYSLAADGRVTRVHQLLYRIENKAGVEDWTRPQSTGIRGIKANPP